MRNRRQYNKKKSSILYNPKSIALIGFVIIIFLSVPLWKKIDKKNRMNAELDSLKNEIAELNTDNEELDKLIEYLKSDDFIERQARLNLGLRKKDEKVFVINGKKEDINKILNTKNNNANINENNMSNSNRWINYFFGS